MNALFRSQDTPYLVNSKSWTNLNPQKPHLTHSQLLQMEGSSLENHVGSILVLTEDGEILYVTESLGKRISALAESDDQHPLVPQEILLISQVLQQCRNQFPSQSWAIEFDIFTKDAIALRIRSRWLKLEGYDTPCILIILEDPQQMVQDMMLDEVQEWGLTPREQEVWLLYQDGHTYSQIAEQLYITINTVKKHMRSVHAKRRAQG